MIEIVLDAESRAAGSRLRRLAANLTPPKVLALGFAGVILTGGILLTLPSASTSGEPTDFLIALFTSTSAVCVTGLVVVDTGTHYSLWGQLVIMGLIQTGGLSFMTMASFLFLQPQGSSVAPAGRAHDLGRPSGHEHRGVSGRLFRSGTWRLLVALGQPEKLESLGD